jgi:hypothetical protein
MGKYAGMNSKLPAWLLLFGLMLCALAAGVWLGVTSVKGLYTAYRSHAWDSTPCIVSSSAVIPPSGRVANQTWSVRATCTYQRDGQFHNIDCSPHLTGSKDLADSQFRSLQVNSGHLCYVNPSDPAEAIFGENQGYLLPLIFLAIGALFIALGWAGAVFLVQNGTS